MMMIPFKLGELIRENKTFLCWDPYRTRSESESGDKKICGEWGWLVVGVYIYIYIYIPCESDVEAREVESKIK